MDGFVAVASRRRWGWSGPRHRAPLLVGLPPLSGGARDQTGAFTRIVIVLAVVRNALGVPITDLVRYQGDLPSDARLLAAVRRQVPARPTTSVDQFLRRLTGRGA